MKNKDKKIKELEEILSDWKGWFYFAVFWIVALIIAIGLNADATRNLVNDFDNYKEMNKPEVINGDLYIGYEDGVRVGYHQDYINESIWYRCVRSCEVIK